MKELSFSQLAGMNQHYRRYSFESYLDNMQQCGISNLELWCGAPHFLLDSKKFSDPMKYKRAASERGLKFVSVCAPSMLWQHQYGVDGLERQMRAVSYYCNAVRVANALDCKVMSVNAGWGVQGEDPESTVSRSIEALNKVADFALEQGVTLALETLQPIESTIVTCLSSAKKYYQKIDHPALKMMTDTVAVGVAGETIDEWFRTFGKDIVHCHLVDGSPSGHKAFGDGSFPLAKMMEAYKKNDYCGYFTMELGSSYLENPFEADKKNINILRNYFK